MSFKKNLKKSLVLGALMSFVITGNVYAASSGSTTLDSIVDGLFFLNNEQKEAIKVEVGNALASGVTSKVEEAVAEALKKYEGGLTATEKEALDKTITGLNSQIADLTAQLGVSQGDLENALADAAAKAEEITDLTDQLTKSQDDLQKALADAEAKAEEIAQLKADLDAGVITQEEYAEKLAAATAEAEAKAKEIADLTANNETIQGLLGDAQAELETLRNQVANAEALKEKIAGLETQLKQYEELKEVLGGGDLSQTLNNLNQVKDDLHKVASLAGTVEETIEQAKAKAAEYEALAKENTKWVQDKIGNFETKLEANIEYTQNALKNKIDTVEGKLSQYEAAIAGKIDKVEDKLNSYEEAIKDNIQYTDGKVNELAGAVKEEIKVQAGILKEVQKNTATILNNTKDITHDGAETTTVRNHLVVGKDLTVGGNASIAGNLAVDGDATVAGTLTAKDVVADNASIKGSLTVNASGTNQVVINDKGITVGLNSTVMDASGFYAGGHNFGEAKAAIDENGNIKGANGLFAVDGATGNVTAGDVVSNGQISANGDVVASAGDKNVSLLDTAAQVEINTANIASNAEAIKANATAIGQNVAAIKSNAEAITANSAAIGENSKAIASNAEAIGQNAQAIKDEAAAREAADKALAGDVTNNTNKINGLNQRLGQMNGKINKVGAGAAALAALHPLEYDPDDKLTFSAGMGNYAGENAAALGAFYRPNEKLMFSLGGTMGNGENMVNLGVSIGLDGATGLAKMSKRELIQKVNSMEAEMAELRALVIKLAAEKK